MSQKNAVAVVRSEFRTSAEKVFDAWLNPEMVGQFMFGPSVRPGEEIIHIQMDPKIGGHFSFKVRRGNEVIDHVGEYLEIERPTRLKFTWQVAGTKDSSTVQLDFVPDKNQSYLMLQHQMSAEWAEFVPKAQESWAKMLGALLKLLMK